MKGYAVISEMLSVDSWSSVVECAMDVVPLAVYPSNSVAPDGSRVPSDSNESVGSKVGVRSVKSWIPLQDSILSAGSVESERIPFPASECVQKAKQMRQNK